MRELLRTKSQMTALSISLILIVYALYIFTANPPSKRQQSWKSTEITHDLKRRAAFQKRIDGILKDTLEKNEYARREAVKQIETTLHYTFIGASLSVDKTVDALTAWKGVTNLTWLLSKDKVKESAEADVYITSVIRENLLDKLITDIQKIASIFNRLSVQLEVNHTRMNTELANAARQFGFTDESTLKEAFPEFSKDFLLHYDTVKEITIESAVGVTGLGVTALFIKGAMASLKRVLDHVVTRFFKTQAISGGLAAVDGPFPIGDAVAVVVEAAGIGSCIYTLYKSRVVLKGELKSGINRSLDDLHRDVQQNTLQYVEKMAAIYEKAEADTANTLMKKLD